MNAARKSTVQQKKTWGSENFTASRSTQIDNLEIILIKK